MSDTDTMMSDDVILSRAEAKNLADFLRRRGIGEHHSLLKRLDPPQPSLRDEVAVLWRDEVIGVSHDSWDEVADHGKARAYEFADAVLAVVRRHWDEYLCHVTTEERNE